ncbi:MAG: hypothetical protein V1644_00565 [Candidatus Micrarchaeota archaeon]
MSKAKKQLGHVKAQRSAQGFVNLNQIDQAVKAEGERDTGAPGLDLCPRCGSLEISTRRIDIPGFAPEVKVCNRCGFRSESAVQVSHPIEYVEEVEEDEGLKPKIEEIEKRLQSANYEKGSKSKTAKPAKPAKAAKPVKKQSAPQAKKHVKQKKVAVHTAKKKKK